jgi:hypothetical protein
MDADWWDKKIEPSPAAKMMGDKHYPDQLRLFQIPDHNRYDYSEALEVFDLVPWFVPRAPSKFAIDEDGNKLMAPIRRDFRIKIDKKEYEAYISISPVSVTGRGKDKGKFVSKYPGIREYNVEKAIRKIATGSNSYFDRQSLTLRFQFKEIEDVIKAMGQKYYTWQIKESLDILAKTNIDLRIEGDIGFVGSIFDIGRSGTSYVVKFCSMYTEALLDRAYCLYNNTKFGSVGGVDSPPLSQWLFMILSIRYKNASETSPYDFYLKSVMRDSPLSDNNASRFFKKLVESLNYLKQKGVLSEVVIGNKVFENRKLVDGKVTAYGSKSFVSDMKKRLHRKKIVDNVLPSDYSDDPVIKDPKDLKQMVSSSRARAKEIGVDLK